MKHFLLLPLLVVVPLVPIRHAYATTNSSITVSTTAHGIRLTLEVPRRSYPRNALIRVGLRLTNLSHRDMPFPHLHDTEGICSDSVMEVFNDQGVILYPPAIQTKPGEPTKPEPGCPVPEIGGRQLHPGQTATGSDLDILRARNLHATVYLSGVIRVRTPTVQLLLTPSLPLRVSISRLSGHVSASIQSGPSLHDTRREVPSSCQLHLLDLAPREVPHRHEPPEDNKRRQITPPGRSNDNSLRSNAQIVQRPTSSAPAPT
jgi:hypothetical protein